MVFISQMVPTDKYEKEKREQLFSQFSEIEKRRIWKRLPVIRRRTVENSVESGYLRAFELSMALARWKQGLGGSA